MEASCGTLPLGLTRIDLSRIAVYPGGLFHTQFAPVHQHLRQSGGRGRQTRVAAHLVSGRLLAMRLGVDQQKISGLWSPGSTPSPGDELLGIYRLIMENL